MVFMDTRGIYWSQALICWKSAVIMEGGVSALVELEC